MTIATSLDVTLAAAVAALTTGWWAWLQWAAYTVFGVGTAVVGIAVGYRALPDAYSPPPRSTSGDPTRERN